MEPTRVRDDGRYLPIRYAEEEAYWAAAEEGRLVVPHCRVCGHLFHPVGPVCPKCLSTDLDWQQVSGRGKISSFVVYHKGWLPWLRDRVPYVVVQVELNEGPRLTTGVVDLPIEAVRIDQPVRATFEDLGGGISLLQFAPQH